MCDVFHWNETWLRAREGEGYNLCSAKASWPEGPWTKEPDLLVFQHRGYLCAVRRNPRIGTFCAYLRVPVGHPWHGKSYRDYEDPTLEALNPHGGLTFSEPGDDGDTGWYLGFDTGHSCDLSPNPALALWGGTYRTLGYVHEELLAMARAAHEAAAS